jgi:hypothetical protein
MAIDLVSFIHRILSSVSLGMYYYLSNTGAVKIVQYYYCLTARRGAAKGNGCTSYAVSNAGILKNVANKNQYVVFINWS